MHVRRSDAKERAEPAPQPRRVEPGSRPEHAMRREAGPFPSRVGENIDGIGGDHDDRERIFGSDSWNEIAKNLGRLCQVLKTRGLQVRLAEPDRYNHDIGVTAVRQTSYQDARGVPKRLGVSEVVGVA